jgi:hypothetical protein
MPVRFLVLVLALVWGTAAAAVEIGAGTKNFTPPPDTPSYFIGEGEKTPTARHFTPPAPPAEIAAPAPPTELASPAPPVHFRAAVAPAHRQVRRAGYRRVRLAKTRHGRHVATTRQVARVRRHSSVRQTVRHDTRHRARSTKVARPKSPQHRVAG